ncbi:MAG: FAD-binding domain-containing protein [Pseudomonadota bacterium]
MSDWHTFTPTRAAGLERSQAFAASAGRAYASTRNHDYGPGNRSNVSCLSPWLRHRLVLEREVIADVLAEHSPNGAEKFIAEVFWRTYFKGWLEHRPEVWDVYLHDVGEIDAAWRADPEQAAALEAALAGETGIACFDAWIEELVTYGYLHNHTRMWFASIWIFTLRLPWQLGADFFLRHLLDGDPASNTLSWRWVGGLHTKGKTYLATASNIVRFTDGRFGRGPQLSRQLADQAPALDEDEEHDRGVLDFSDVPGTGPCVLLIGEDDCSAETLTFRASPVAIIASHAASMRSPATAVSAAVMGFTDSAIQNAAERASAHYDVAHEIVAAEALGEKLVALCAEKNVDRVVVARPPVGPFKDLLARIAPSLAAEGFTIERVGREYDQAAWPHASKGFFGLKKKIPGLIKSLDLALPVVRGEAPTSTAA